MTYSKAHVLLDAVQFAADVDTSSFGRLVVQHSHVLTQELSLRILLTYLPESTPPSQYVDLVRDIAAGNVASSTTSQLPQPSQNLSKAEATSRARKLRLLPLPRQHSIAKAEDDVLARFVLGRARKIDGELGSLTILHQLVEPFVEQSETLKEWTVATLMPLVRLDYEYYPDVSRIHNLESFERLHGYAGVEALTATALESRHKKEEHWGRDIRGIVGPWVLGEVLWRSHKILPEGPPQTKIGDIVNQPQAQELFSSCWSEIYEWLLALAKTDSSLALEIFDEWDGPSDVDYGGLLQKGFEGNALSAATIGYAQAGLAMFYQHYDLSLASPEKLNTILAKVAKVSGLLPPPDVTAFRRERFSTSVTSDFLNAVSTVHLLPAELLEPANPLTKPSSEALELAFLTVISTQLLDSLGSSLALNRVVSLALFASQGEQFEAFRKLLHGFGARLSTNDREWWEAREMLLWLRGWQSGGRPEQVRHGIFAQLDLGNFENEILKTLVTNGHYHLASEVYCDAERCPLPKDQVERSILEVLLASYDNASNGNRTRGGVKKANEIREAFKSHFASSRSFRQASALISATHRLSFYSLTLQHGVPFLPVNIRVSSDPLSLIDRVLQQNSRSYTKLDDLLDIGRDLVKAGLIKDKGSSNSTEADAIGQVERSITAKAIEASLTEDDFDTAYSYIVNRLSASHPVEASGTSADDEQEVLWKAAYQAGRYRPKAGQGPSELRRLEQRMELLSQALLLAPPSSLQDVLKTWRTCEMELNAALAKETEEEQAWNDKGERTVPGGFTLEDIAPQSQNSRETTRKALNEEAPMSLFDVTRNAAAALSKSAFPLRGQRQGIAASHADAQLHEQPSPVTSEGDGVGRIRKRDMVSNMVTGGLASGIGWVIGKSSHSLTEWAFTQCSHH